MGWIAMLTVMLGLVGAAGSTFAGASDCAMPGEMQGASHCQWMMPAACCDQPSSVSGSTAVVSKPSIVIALSSAPDEPAGWPSRAPAQASGSPQRVCPGDVVLRL